MGLWSAVQGRTSLIVNGVDVNGVDVDQGLMLRCPWCNIVSPFEKEWRGKDIACPNPDCNRPLRVNEFVVGP